MKVGTLHRPRALALGLVTAVLCALALLAPSAALADHTQQSIFQDDQYLIYGSYRQAVNTLTALKMLGVQQIRVTVKWSSLAPSPLSHKVPGGYFNPTIPSSYPAANWAPYDRVIQLAQRDGIAVNLDITGPGPLWAMGRKSPTTRAADHWYPNSVQWLYFFYAVALRYDGHYYKYPHVSSWSVWNEPNQPGWLSPQSQKIKGQWTAVSPRLYRDYVSGAYAALALTGHSADQILIGETAPEGSETPGFYAPMTPLPFLRDVYCVDSRYRPLTGAAGKALGCGSPSKFVKANPGLFHATGFAHHPYYFFHSPNTNDPDPNTAPIANTGRLERALDRSRRAWGVRHRMPIWFTEYGYQTNPPDPFQTVSPAQQAVYLNEADYLAWLDPRVKSVAQFLLYDAAPDPRYKPTDFGYWDTFQTGLLTARGRPKPAFASYRFPIWIPQPTFKLGQGVFIWGQIRPASSGIAEAAQVQWRGTTGPFKALTTIATKSQDGYLTGIVKPPGTGVIRLAWTSPRGLIYSRNAPVTAG
ncbi:MAG: hypothetical protein ACYDHH_01630 [Solirubrobacteraceae bacterium]